VLPKIINAAQKHNIRLWLGTHYNNNFWDAVEYPEQKAREWLDHQLTMLKKRLPALISTVRHADPDHQTVIGWYISEEIDDQNWMLAGKEQALTDYLYKTVKLLRSEEPEWPIMISGFSNGYTPPIELAFFWKQILASTGIDTLLFQDGVGADKLSLKQFADYAIQLGTLNDMRSEQVTFVVELFEITKEKGVVKLHTATPARVFQQLAEANKITRKGITLFSAPDYLLNQQDKNALALLSAWLQEKSVCSKIK